MTGRITENGGLLRSLISITVGLLLAGIILQVSGYDPREAGVALWSGATGIEPGAAEGPNNIGFGAGALQGHLNKFALAQSLAKVTPLILTGLAVALGLRAGLFNIGAQGQMIVGAMTAAVVGSIGIGKSGEGGLSPFLHIPLTLLAGMAGGAVWGAIPGLLKALRGVHEVISTIMLNYIAANIVGYLILHNFKDPNSKTMAAQSGVIAKSAWMALLVPNGNLSAGIFLAITAAILVSFLMRRTALGYEIRAVGLGSDAARAAGIPVSAILVKTMALSGALAGLAGAIEVMGVQHRYLPGIAGNYGFDGIAVALLGGLTGGGVALSAIFFGMLASGASVMQVQTNVPDSIAVVVQAVVVISIGIRLKGKAMQNALLAAVADTDERQLESETT